MLPISDIHSLFEGHLQANRFAQAPQGLYEPLNYLLQLGGKRLRPLLTLLSHQLFDPRVSYALDAALAVEWFHNFTLAHDDIMDQAELRRGQAAVHSKYGVNTAILSGDVLMIQVYRLLGERYPPEIALPLVKTMTAAAIAVCEGQQRDMEFEQIPLVSEADYLDMIRGKTAVLIGAAMQMGAISAGADAAAAAALYAFGRDAGLAFQIRDDLLDAFGDPLLTGKQAGGDILRGKKTLLFIHAGNSASEALQAELLQLYDPMADLAADHKIERVRELFEESGARDYCEQMIRRLYDNACIQLERIQADPLAIRYLREVSDQLIERQK